MEGPPSALRALAPGLPHGLFGAWAAEVEGRAEGVGARLEGLRVGEQRGQGEEEGDWQPQQYAGAGGEPGASGKVLLDDLFR